jgi:amylosucrase
MYEQVSHALLNDILDELKPAIRRQDLRHFYTRLGANFYAVYSLFHHLYGQRPDFKEQILRLVERLALAYVDRPAELERLDMEREEDHNWFLSQEWVGMALYSDGFAGDLAGLESHLPYLQELGVSMVHVMPILQCPRGASDGGYAVSDFRAIDERAGTLEDVRHLSASMRKRAMLLALDVVVNHTSDEHVWAQRAREGDRVYQDYY